MSIILDTPVTELVQHSRTICANSKPCLLCGQRLLQAGRVKTHWRASHEEAWKACGQQASAASRSLCALFRKPYPFCGSQAKDIKLHSQQCPMMFQIQAFRSMKHQGLDWRAMSGSKQAKAKQVRDQPTYKSFVSPMKVALAKGSARPAPKSNDDPKTCQTQDIIRPKAPKISEKWQVPIRTIAEVQQKSSKGTIQAYFQRQARSKRSGS